MPYIYLSLSSKLPFSDIDVKVASHKTMGKKKISFVTEKDLPGVGVGCQER